MSPIPSAVRERSERRGRVGCIPKWLTADSHRWRGASVDNFNLLFPYEILDVLAIELNYVQLSKLRNNLIDWTPCSKLDAVETGWSRQGLLLSPRLQTSLTAQWRRGWERWRCWLTGTGSSSWEGGKVREGYHIFLGSVVKTVGYLLVIGESVHLEYGIRNGTAILAFPRCQTSKRIVLNSEMTRNFPLV